MSWFQSKFAWSAVRSGDPQALASCLDSGVSPNIVNTSGQSLLHLACEIGFLSLLSF
jgi:ankyrin repeat protein